MLDSPDPEDRRDAIYEIADAGGDEMESAALIGPALYDPEPDVRLSAVEALTGLRSESSADWLSIALGDPDPRVRRTAVEALGEIGGRTARFLLQQALGDADAGVREAAQADARRAVVRGSRRQLTVSFSPSVSSASLDGSGRARSPISLRAAMKSLAWFTASSAISSPSRR